MENYIQILNNLATYNSSQIKSYNAQINDIYAAIDQFMQQMTDFNTFIDTFNKNIDDLNTDNTTIINLITYLEKQ